LLYKDCDCILKKINNAEEIKKSLFFSALHNRLKDKEDYADIIRNEEVVLIQDEDYQISMRKFIDEVENIEKEFIEIIEKELRKLLRI